MSGCPILLVKTNSIPAPTTQAFTELWISKTVVIGGSGVISDTVFNQLPGSQRISGSNRYNTAIALAERFLPAETSRVFIATGTDFPDAIAGGVLAAKYNSGVLLVRGDLPAPNQAVQDFLQSKNIGFASIFGGSGAVSAKLEQWLKDNLK
jgi:putative cell wall-binding protein